MGTRKIGPQIAAGCTAVIKPAKQTPLSMLALAQILEEAGLPGGVLNVITAKSSGSVMEPLIRDPRARKLSFTGSTEVGRKLIEQSAEQVLRVSMELGGNAPFLVFEDADVDDAVEGAMIAKMRNIGEACTAANRFHVHESVADEFAEKLAAQDARPEDRPRHRGGREGRPADRRRAEGEGRRARRRRGRQGGEGALRRRPARRPRPLLPADRLADVPDDARLLKEEIFGPVAPIKGFATDDEAIAAANDTEYGLVAYVYTKDLKRAMHVCEALETGMVGLNQGLVSNAGAPFGGVKQSGFGREGGHEGIAEYLEVKYVAMKL